MMPLMQCLLGYGESRVCNLHPAMGPAKGNEYKRWEVRRVLAREHQGPPDQEAGIKMVENGEVYLEDSLP